MNLSTHCEYSPRYNNGIFMVESTSFFGFLIKRKDESRRAYRWFYHENSVIVPRRIFTMVERFMNYLEEQTDGEAMINSIKNGDQPLPRVTHVSIAGTSSTEQPPLKDKSMWSDQEKYIQKIDRLARSLLIQGLSNDIYSLIDSNKTAKDLWDALVRHMLGYKYGEQDRKATVLYEYEMFEATEGELLLDTYIRYFQVINDLKKCGYSIDNFTSDPLALIVEKTKVSKRKEKVVVSSDSKGSDADDFSELKKITAFLPIRKEFVKTNDKKVEKKDDEKRRDVRKVKCYNYKKEGHFAKDCKKVKAKDYEYYKTKMLLVKKDKVEQVLLVEDQAWMESKSDSDQEINANITSSAYDYNDAMNVSCNSRLYDLFDENDLFIFDDESVRISPVSKMPFRKKPRDSLNLCSKHIVEKFLGTGRFGNNDFVVIVGYGDVVIGSMTIKKVYYVEGLRHNLFSVAQFCDKGLEVAFRKSTCFVRNEDGLDLLT
nr:retrovirus-related Pol polyprotein from transposon TNT 1-94 [Tanacetum cinerariifolium]